VDPDIELMLPAVEVLGPGAIEGDGALAVGRARRAAELRRGDVIAEPAVRQRRELRAPGNQREGANI